MLNVSVYEWKFRHQRLRHIFSVAFISCLIILMLVQNQLLLAVNKGIHVVFKFHVFLYVQILNYFTIDVKEYADVVEI